jgi:hypothetical protein
VRRRALVVLSVAALLPAACARPPATLHVESAHVAFPGAPGAAGRLELAARFTELRIDPEKPVRLDVGQSARWVRLERVPDTEDVWTVDGEEHGYRLTLDLDAGRVTAVEPDAVPRDGNPLDLGLGQGMRAACARIRFAEASGSWSFDAARDGQTSCVCRPGDPQGSAKACTPPIAPKMP